MNSHLLPLFISYRSSGEKLIKYQANTSCVIMSIILMTTLFYKALILQGEIWCWSLLGLKGLKEIQPIIAYTPEELFYCTKQASLSERVHFQWFQRFMLKTGRESIVSIQNGTRLRGGWKSQYYNLLWGFDFYLCSCSWLCFSGRAETYFRGENVSS